MNTNINQPPTRFAPFHFNGATYGIPGLAPIAEVFRILPDMVSKHNFHQAHEFAIQRLSKILGNDLDTEKLLKTERLPLEQEQAHIWCVIAEIAGFNFFDYYTSVLVLKYFHLVLPIEIETPKDIYDGISSKKIKVEKYSDFEVNSDLFPSYEHCNTFVQNCDQKVEQMAFENDDIATLIKQSKENQLKIARQLRYSFEVSGKVSPFICKKCRKYQFFDRGKGKGIPEFCSDECRDSYQNVGEAIDVQHYRGKNLYGWKPVKTKAKRPTCEHCGGRSSINVDSLCFGCYKLKKGIKE